MYNRGKLEKETNWWKGLGRVDNLPGMAGGRGAAAFRSYRVILGEKSFLIKAVRKTMFFKLGRKDAKGEKVLRVLALYQGFW